uniref:Guanine deaminase n=1 Tax=Hucho hucho TaxID=62062 RepID=A0A4W5K2S5_9TELE
MTSSNESTVDIAHVYRGTFVHSTDHTAVEILEDRLLGVDTEGKIAFIGSGQEVYSLSQKWRFEALAVTQLGQYEFFMPGMVDTHIHASQYSYAGTALDLPLLQWLNTYTFPVEACYKDLGFARNVYTHVVKRTLRNGTTTACYFATIHTDASLLLGQIANDFGQRALVGKVCMDTNNFVPHYRETPEESHDETNRFISELLEKKYPLVRPVVTPRFAPSCSAALLGHLGEIAQNNHLHIQSHISETKEEVKLVKELFPDYDSYTDVYHKHNLLTDKVSPTHTHTVQGHSVDNEDHNIAAYNDSGGNGSKYADVDDDYNDSGGNGSKYADVDDDYNDSGGNGSKYADVDYNDSGGQGSKYADDDYNDSGGQGSKYADVDDDYNDSGGQGSKYADVDDDYNDSGGNGSKYADVDDDYNDSGGNGCKYADVDYNDSGGNGCKYADVDYNDSGGNGSKYADVDYNDSGGNGCKYADVDDKGDGSQTVMAHGCHLTDEELKLFREKGASIAHCPNSNISLCSGMLDARRVLNHKVKLGLGTDVAGGYSPSMLDAVRRTLDTSKVLTIQDPQYQTLTFEEVFRLATLGGSQALSLDEHTGNFKVGKDFDALRVNTAIEGGPIDLINHGEGPKVLLEKFLNLGDDRNIAEVYVAGKRVVPFVERP